MFLLTVGITIISIFLCMGLMSLSESYAYGSRGRMVCNFVSNIFFFTAIVGLLWLIIGFCGSIVIEHKPESEPYAVEKIVSLQDNNGYFVARYTVNNTSNYVYMRDNENGSYCQGSIKAEGVSVYYTVEEPRIEWYKSVGRCLGFEDSYDTPILYLPPGTILEQFSIDLK